MSRTTVGVAALLVLGACSPARPARTAPSSDSHLITHPQIAREIARAGVEPAYELIRNLRPRWRWECWGGLFVDGAYVGKVTKDDLDQVSSVNIVTIQCLETGQAYARFGFKAEGGAILINTVQ